MNNNQQLPCRKIKASSRKIVPLIALSLFLIAIIPVYYPFLNNINYSPKASHDSQSINPTHHAPLIQLHLHQDKPTHVALAAATAADDDDDDDPEIIIDIPADAEKDYHPKVVVVQLEKEKAALPAPVQSELATKIAPIREEPPKTNNHDRVQDQKQKHIKRASTVRRGGRRGRGGGRKRKRAAAKNRSAEEARPAATVTNYDNTEQVMRRKEDQGGGGAAAANSNSCDISVGEWVPNPEGPYYTNSTCSAIQEHQNCLKFGRPDTGFLKWRWKPEGCELPLFEPLEFLEMMRGKKMAFVGDSVARNHMQSLICLLSTVEEAVDVSEIPYGSQFKRYEFRRHKLIIAIFWSPYLVRTSTQDEGPPSESSRPFNLFLDDPDPNWTQKIPGFDYVIISAGHWFFRPSMFYIQGRLAGCLYCPQPHVPHLTSYFSYRRAFRTAFRAIVEQEKFRGITYLRSFAPSHFENGYWDKGGDCVRVRPLRREETRLEGYNMEHYRIQMEEVKIAQRVGRGRGMRFRMMDVTRAMLMRPDGHPSKYGHWANPNVSSVNDCVHWCLPGPVDSWNDILIELLRREESGEEEELELVRVGR